MEKMATAKEFEEGQIFLGKFEPLLAFHNGSVAT